VSASSFASPQASVDLLSARDLSTSWNVVTTYIAVEARHGPGIVFLNDISTHTDLEVFQPNKDLGHKPTRCNLGNTVLSSHVTINF